MPIRKSVQAGNKLLREKAEAVSNIKGKRIARVIEDLIDSMRHNNLVGMAAPQIGFKDRVFISEIRNTKLRKIKNKKDLDSLRVYINPKILLYSKKKVFGYEGCGSVANGNLFGLVKRPISLTVEAYDEKGTKFKLKANNLLARIIQHENDHLNGILFTDRALPKSYMSRDEYLKMMKKRK